MDKATDGQRRVMTALNGAIAANDRLFVWWMGGVRSGKSYGAAMAFLEHCRHRENAQYIVLAYTASQAAKIYGPYFKLIGESMGMTVNVSRGTSDPKIDVWPDGRAYKRGMDGANTFLLRGADKEGRDKAIQGLTVDGLLADEVPLLHRATLHQAEARVSKPGGLRIYTSNKQSEYHWTAKYYLKRIVDGSIDGIVIDSNVAENSNIDPDYIAERSSEYEGNTLKRFMDNEFGLDGTPIYPVGLNMHENIKGEAIMAVYGHPGGYEVIVSRLQRSPKLRLTMTGAASYPATEDIAALVKKTAERPLPLILLNGEQAILARSLRRLGCTVRGYQSGWRPSHGEILATACRNRWFWMQGNQTSLVEAVRTYDKPGAYGFPIMQAVESLALILRPFVSQAHP